MGLLRLPAAPPHRERSLIAQSVTIIQLRAKQEELQDALAYFEGKQREARADLLHASAVLRLFGTNDEVQQFLPM